MQKLNYQDKYPITEIRLLKAQSARKTIDEVVGYFQERIAANEKAVHIATFDHFAHTQRIGGEINPEILGAMNVVFCFGKVLPDAQVMALRPRSIAVTEMADQFVVSFMDAPIQAAHETMCSWVLDLFNEN